MSGAAGRSALAPALVALVLAPSLAHAAAAVPVASYELHASLDPASHVLEGRGTIRWRNGSRTPQSELFLHVYLNAFKNDRSLFLRSGAGAGFRGEGLPTEWGYCRVRRLFAREHGRDLWPGVERHSPGDPEDETDVRVPLGEPVAPGGSLTLDVEWTAKLPSVVMRTGHAGSFHMVAQWFPKLARLEPDGRWAHFAFHPLSEFYADFGDYDVEIDVPAGYVVGATGQQISEQRGAGRVRRRFAAPSVHDFAFAAWDGFRELGRAGPGGVRLRCLYPPGADGQAATELDAAARALRDLGELFGDYPYPTLTLVHPPEDAAEAGGMEYPTLIATGGSWYWPLVGLRGTELVTVHELAHQWFYGLVATDEHRWPLLDEGLASYAEGAVLERWYPRASLFRGLGFALAIPDARRLWALGPRGGDVVARQAEEFPSGGDYVRLVYGRTASLLETLERIFGRERIRAALGDYARRQRFAHPGPEDLFVAVRQHAGNEAAEALRLGLEQGGWADYAVERLWSEPAAAPAGLFGDPPSEAQAGLAPGTAPWRGEILVRRYGTLRLPVDVALRDADGRERRVSWDGQADHLRIPYAGEAPLAAAVVDPDHRVLVDEDLANNALAAQPLPLAPRVLAGAAYVANVLMELLGP
ncbi:MAG: M1 family metallopeptidase [Deltaproteobacteria bacterium]|nr:M1 family metallopeptidase [Deltaproteobacteria bacterium]